MMKNDINNWEIQKTPDVIVLLRQMIFVIFLSQSVDLEKYF